MSSQPTQSSVSNQSGNVSNSTEVQTRRSSRVTTPMKRSGMIQPSPDSRRSITQPLLSERTSIGTSSQPRKRTNAPSDSDSTPQATPVQSQQTRKKAPKKPKKTGPAAANSESNTTAKDVDLAQDSDEENSKVKKRQRKNPEEDDVKVFFSEPFRRKDDPANKPASTYSCLWCKKEVRVSASSLSNLRVHRDGSRQSGRVSDGCPNRAKAIAAGAKLPPTSLEEEKKKKKNGNGDLTTHFARVEKFDNTILNQIIVLWLLRQSIPWNRVEDPYLKAAFNYCEPAAILFKQKWAATGARKAYLELQEAMLYRLKTTDSGSNNMTMAETMHEKLLDLGENTDFEWDPKTMHIKCFCHKMALVVNAGLKELGLKSPPPPKLKKAFLGSFPYSNKMPKITEEDEDGNEGDDEDDDSNNGRSYCTEDEKENSDDDDNDDDEDDDDDNDDSTEDEGENGKKDGKKNGKKDGNKDGTKDREKDGKKDGKKDGNKSSSKANRNDSNDLNELTTANSSEEQPEKV
ncbi:hypothetical protein PGT21_007171 [Puccinia graminis f. sp. tritici]|uniref:Uncharacterized protein n=1 Tax=Puccinia graminis f. sp. tritici TaxID=56615 RepID=A0A5B0M935_PUCGR|nr:hypothetical protein PGT21_007171 [Puccinia graminis f. sp. tritici]